MKRKRLLCIVTTAVLFFACAGIIALCQEYGPGVVYIDNTTKATLRYLPVEFNHQNHQADYDISCVTCHHTMDDDFVSGVPPVCSSCHNMDADITLKDAMHRNCVLCHMDMVAEGMSPPTECLGCHEQRL